MLNAKGGHDHCGVGTGVLAAVNFYLFLKSEVTIPVQEGQVIS